MSETSRLLIALVAAAALSLALVPLVRVLALRANFLDRPTGYKAHRAATPYLGGVAVIAAFLVAAAIAGDAFDGWLTLITCVLLLCAVGIIDDKVNLPIEIRLAVQVGAAIALWTANIGWMLTGSDAVNLLITIVWVVGISNAFNLMDNQDGAAASVAAGCGIGIAVLAQIQGDVVVAALALALVGACVGFLPYNLASPSRIFLGDGGSMPIGLIVAALIMAVPWGSADVTNLLIAVPLAGIPILDTTLVVISRRRGARAVLSGARDHLTHRLLAGLRTPRRVALALASAQAALCALSVAMAELDQTQVALIAVFYLGLGAAAIFTLDHPRWFPGTVARRAQIAEELSA